MQVFSKEISFENVKLIGYDWCFDTNINEVIHILWEKMFDKLRKLLVKGMPNVCFLEQIGCNII